MAASEVYDYELRESKIKYGILNSLKYVVLVIACLVVIIPLMVVFIGSFKENKEFLS